MMGSTYLCRIGRVAGLAYLLSAGSASFAQEIIDPAARATQTVPAGAQTTTAQAPGARQTKRDTAPGVQPLDRLVTRIENRVRNRVENRVDRDYDPQADPAASYAEATRRTRAVAPARRRR